VKSGLHGTIESNLKQDENLALPEPSRNRRIAAERDPGTLLAIS
jgi:hypothetical protein